MLLCVHFYLVDKLHVLLKHSRGSSFQDSTNTEMIVHSAFVMDSHQLLWGLSLWHLACRITIVLPRCTTHAHFSPLLSVSISFSINLERELFSVAVRIPSVWSVSIKITQQCLQTISDCTVLCFLPVWACLSPFLSVQASTAPIDVNSWVHTPHLDSSAQTTTIAFRAVFL